MAPPISARARPHNTRTPGGARATRKGSHLPPRARLRRRAISGARGGGSDARERLLRTLRYRYMHRRAHAAAPGRLAHTRKRRALPGRRGSLGTVGAGGCWLAAHPGHWGGRGGRVTPSLCLSVDVGRAARGRGCCTGTTDEPDVQCARPSGPGSLSRSPTRPWKAPPRCADSRRSGRPPSPPPACP